MKFTKLIQNHTCDSDCSQCIYYENKMSLFQCINYYKCKSSYYYVLDNKKLRKIKLDKLNEISNNLL